MPHGCLRYAGAPRDRQFIVAEGCGGRVLHPNEDRLTIAAATIREERHEAPPATTADHLDLGGFPETDRFDAWRALTEPFFEVRLPEATERPFEGAVTTFAMNEALLIHSRVSGQHYRRDPGRARAGEWDQVAFQLYRAGTFRGDYDGEDVHVGPGDLNVIDFTRPYAKHSTDEADINLIVPREMASRHVPGFRHGGVLRGGSGIADLLGLHLDVLMGAGQAMTTGESDSAVRAFLIVVGGTGLRGVTPGERASLRASARATAARFIALHLFDPKLDPDRIAKACGLSRASLFRVFEIDGGVRRYIQGQRLSAAFVQIRAGTSEPIRDIADRCGFPDPARFSRLFRATFGCTPSEARWDQEGTESMSPPAASDPESWLSALRRLRAQDTF